MPVGTKKCCASNCGRFRQRSSTSTWLALASPSWPSCSRMTGIIRVTPTKTQSRRRKRIRSAFRVISGSSARTRREREKKRITNDDLRNAEFGEFLRKASVNLLAVTKGAVYICMSSSELHTLQKAYAAAGGHWSTFVIWAKDRFTL